MDVSLWFVNTVTAEPLLGIQNSRPKYGDPVEVPCWVEDGNELVRNGSGDEVVSSTRVYADTEWTDTFPVGSHVTTPSGRVATVLGIARFDSGSLDLGLDHIVVNLT